MGKTQWPEERFPSMENNQLQSNPTSLENITIVYTEQSKNCNYCPVYIEQSPNGGRTFRAYITGAIKDVDSYIDLIDILFTASENDTFYIYIDSPGGMVASGSILSSAIHHSAAQVFTIARGFCASAACLIHNAAHKNNAKAEAMAVLMIHMSSHIDSGRSTSIEDRAKAQVKYVQKNLLQHAVELGYMTTEELDNIAGGDEIFITADDFYKRIGTNSTEEHDEPILMLEKEQ